MGGVRLRGIKLLKLGDKKEADEYSDDTEMSTLEMAFIKGWEDAA
jgi:hypothetical protein